MVVVQHVGAHTGDVIHEEEAGELAVVGGPGHRERAFLLGCEVDRDAFLTTLGEEDAVVLPVAV